MRPAPFAASNRLVGILLSGITVQIEQLLSELPMALFARLDASLRCSVSHFGVVAALEGKGPVYLDPLPRHAARGCCQYCFQNTTSFGPLLFLLLFRFFLFLVPTSSTMLMPIPSDIGAFGRVCAIFRSKFGFWAKYILHPLLAAPIYPRMASCIARSILSMVNV